MIRFQPWLTISNTITCDLTRTERARGFLEAAALSGDWIERMSQRALLLEAHHTTHIEGTRLTLEQSERLFAGENVPDADPDDVRELLNYRDAFEFVSSYLHDGRPLTEGLVPEIHRHLVTGVRGGDALPGQYLDIEQLQSLCPGVTRRSLQRDLKSLLGKEILCSHGGARATRYSLESLDL